MKYEDIDFTRFVPLDEELQCIEVRVRNILVMSFTKHNNVDELEIEFQEKNVFLTMPEIEYIIQMVKQKIDDNL
jgi:hypothetical protein